MASGPWFYFDDVTINGNPDLPDVAIETTELRLTPPFPNPPDTPISSSSWV
jgi:hypothetical protein